MFESVLRVKYVSFKNCFVYLSPAHSHLNTGVCIKVAYGEREAYFSAAVKRNVVGDEAVGINASYAKVLGINEGELVNVVQIEHLPVINSIGIQPFSESDFKILEMLAQNVQSNLLDQVRVINADQKLIIWIGNNLSVTVIVDSVQPIAPGTLDFLTEVVIKPPDNYGLTKKNKKANFKKNPPPDNKEFLNFLNKNAPISSEIKSLYNSKPLETCCYRLVPLSEITRFQKVKKSFYPFAAFVRQRSSTFRNFYSMTLLNGPYVEKKLFVKLYFLEDHFNISDPVFNDNNTKNIFVSDSILRFMATDFGSRVVFREVETIPCVTEIEVHAKKSYYVNPIEKLKFYLAKHCETPLIWSANFPLEIDSQLFCSLKFLPNSSEYCVIDKEFLRDCSYSVCDDLVKPLEKIQDSSREPEDICMTVAPAKETYKKALSLLFGRQFSQAENVILSGKPGMGKSSILNHIAFNLKRFPYFLNTETVRCKEIKGKTVDSLHKYFNDVLVKLIVTQPSVLILDDLHVLCEYCEGEETPNSVYINRVSEMVSALLNSILKRNFIGVLASTEAVSKLNKHLYRSRGNYLFKNVLTIEDLNKADRIVLLKHFFDRHSAELNYDELSVKTDGFVIQDLKDFYTKTLFEAHKEAQGPEPIAINSALCEAALKKSCALSLQNVKFNSSGTKSFDDIGGLHGIKDTLIESLLWPVKYASIFAKAPLRLQSGILLYGPPGTGKTLLALAAARQCHLRLISIKGPELLSKYIGASEQGVRDVFQKAQSAKPCVLFFDEFDSLAPRRGHDNTGVTDRVVNQLLTQLDGVEALTGVCVLAATSRPDLLDPALLRPGRLDKQLLCPMPNLEERLEILQVLSRKLELAEDVALEEVAKRTEGYSGADLQSLLYTAQLLSLNDLSREDDMETKPIKIVSQDLLMEALDSTRPSLTQNERAKYERIYAKFPGGDVEEFRAGSKVTLA